MLSLIFAFMTAFGITFLSIPSIIKVAKEKNLFDVPDSRKHHEKRVPTLGGLGIFAGLIFSLTFWSNQKEIIELQYILSAIIILFFIGMKDDLTDLRALKKLLGQLAAAFILVHYAGIRLTTFYGLFGFDAIPVWFSYILSIFTIIVITNAFNLIDGIDCLAGCVGIVSSLFFGIWFYFLGQYQYCILVASLTGALLAFLYYNKTPARIFMGDTGSLILGLISSLLAIKFIEFIRVLDIDHPYKIQAVPVITIAILVIPLFDTIRVFTIRIANGRSPFDADRNHIHHMLVDMGLSHLQATGLMISFNIGVIILTYAFQKVIEGEVLLGLLLGACVCMNFFLTRKRRRQTV